MEKHVLTGFGFGPIQAGLFAAEAYQSNSFGRLVIADVDAQLVDAVNANRGIYSVNVAGADGIVVSEVRGVELLNPTVQSDRKALMAALTQSTEIVTALPSVDFYLRGNGGSIASLIGHGLSLSEGSAVVVYAAENHNHAAEILRNAIAGSVGFSGRQSVQFLNTVIGKMSRTVTGTLEVAGSALAPVAPGLDRAFLVEKFNRIFVNRCIIDDFEPGIGLFVEKDDLLPYEEAKLYGHNAIHALLGYLGFARGYGNMTELGNDKELLRIARTALYNESGAALIRKHAGIDELFTKDGYRRYAEDLLARIMNPWLGDTLERAGRNVVRKLGCNDRLFGTMSLALDQGIRPVNMALGAVAALHYLLTESEQTEIPEDLRFRPSELAKLPTLKTILAWIWPKEDVPHRAELTELVREAFPAFMTLLK